MHIAVFSKDPETVKSLHDLFANQNSIQLHVLTGAGSNPASLPFDIDLIISDIDQLSNRTAANLMDRDIPVIALKQAKNTFPNDLPALHFVDKPLYGDNVSRLLHAVSSVSRIHQILKAGRFQRQLLDSIPDIVMVIDDKYRVVRINRAMLYHLFPSAKLPDNEAYRSVLGQRCHQVMFSRDRPCHMYGDTCPLVGMSDRLALAETMISCNGRHFHLTMTPLIEADEKPLYFVEVVRDVSSQVNATRALEIRYAFEQVLARASAEMIQDAEVVSDIDGVSQAMNRIAGFIKADHWYLFECDSLGNTLNILFENASDSAPVRSLADPAHLTGWDLFQKKILTESSILHVPDFESFTLEGTPILPELDGVKSIVLIPFNRGDTFTRILGFETHAARFDWSPDILIMFRVFGEVINNAVDRNRNALELRREEARYRRLTDNLPDLVWRIRQNGLVEYVNPAIETILGYARDRVIGTSITNYLPDADLKRVSSVLNRIRDLEPEKRYFRFKEDLRRQDGRSIPCEIGITFDRDQKGNIAAYEGIIRDLSESRQAEREKADLQQQFYRAQRLEAIGSMASGLAHEINNPVGIIIGFAEYLIDSAELAEHQIENIRLIHQEAIRIKELTQRLLDFARSDTFNMKNLNIHTPLSDCIKLVAHTFNRRNIQIQTCFDETIPNIRGDSNALKQVFMNILINAMEAIPADIPGIIDICTLQTDSHDIRIEIADNGVGIPEDQKERIFDPFFSAKEKGSGLGLSISAAIVEKHNGTLKCTSKVGIGTTFSVELPILRNDAKRYEGIGI